MSFFSKLFSKKGLTITGISIVVLSIVGVICYFTGLLDPYRNLTIEISTPQQFYDYMVKGFPSIKNNGENYDKYVLTADIDLAGYESIWNKDGEELSFGDEYSSPESYFYFDGQNHTIKNIKVHGTRYASLFGKLYGDVTVKNLKVESAQITGSLYVGVIAGEVGNATISNITVKNCTVASTGSQYIGGIVGRSRGTTTISNITVDNTSVGVAGTQYIGGVVGGVENISTGNDLGGKFTLSNATIDGCTIGSSNADYVGGAVGRISGTYENHGTVKDCTVVRGTIIGDENVGGVIGEQYQAYEGYKEDRLIEYKNLKCNASITGRVSVGGIMGNLYYVDYDNYTFTNCETTNEITVDIEAAEKNAGGILGSSTYDLDVFSVPRGSQLNFVNCKNTSRIKSPLYAGGIAGKIDDKMWKVSFTDCTNSYTIDGTSYAGGICGYIEGDIIGAQQFKFTNCTNTGTVSGSDYVAGILAYNAGLTETILFKNCKNLSDTQTIMGVKFVAGISSVYGTFEDCENSMDLNYPTWASETNPQYFGGIVAKGTDASFVNCKNSGNIFNYSSYPTLTVDYVGGIAGYNEKLYLTGCENSGVIAGTNNVGGFIGKLDALSSSEFVNTIKDCSQTGDVYAMGQQTTTAQNYIDNVVCGNIGILFGYLDAGALYTFENITASANINVLRDTNYVGGWCGRMEFYYSNFKLMAQQITMSYTINYSANVSSICKENMKYGANVFDTESDLGTFNDPTSVA